MHTLRPGDHIVTSFIPSCGHCRWCASGLQSLCDNGAMLFDGTQLDGTFRMHVDGRERRAGWDELDVRRVQRDAGDLLREGPRGHPDALGVPGRLRRADRIRSAVNLSVVGRVTSRS